MTPFLVLMNLLEQLTELKETFIFSSLLKDTGKQPDEERYSGRSGRRSAPSTGASVPTELSCVILPACGCIHQPGSSLDPILIIFYGGFLI